MVFNSVIMRVNRILPWIFLDFVLLLFFLYRGSNPGLAHAKLQPQPCCKLFWIVGSRFDLYTKSTFYFILNSSFQLQRMWTGFLKPCTIGKVSFYSQGLASAKAWMYPFLLAVAYCKAFTVTLILRECLVFPCSHQSHPNSPNIWCLLSRNMFFPKAWWFSFYLA